MSPDEFQQAWKAQSDRTRITIDADTLADEVKRSQEDFRRTVLLRDYREAGIAIVMIPMWFVLGMVTSQPWTFYLTVPALLWIAGFIIVDRMRHPKGSSAPGVALMDSAKASLTDVEHQIWLLRNVSWWYLLPCTLSILTYFAHASWLTSGGNWLIAIGVATPFFIFLFVLYGFIYSINQRAVRRQLEPRRQELLTLLHSLSDESSHEVFGEYPILTGPACGAYSRRRMLVASLCALVLFAIGIGGIYLIDRYDRDYPKESPFRAVRWDDLQPEVQVDGVWYRLESLNGIPVEEIVAFSREKYEDLWRKRFEEDLVELLTRMGHSPGDTVTLVVQPLDSAETVTLEDVPMTRSNREAVRDAAEAREDRAEEEGMLAAVSIDDAELFRERIDAFLRAARRETGFGGAVIVARGGEPVYAGAFGISHRDSEAPNTVDTPFRIASLSKQFTAAAIFRLEGQEKLSVDDPVQEYLPAFAAAPYRGIMIHHLLTHTSGLPRTPKGPIGGVRWGGMSKKETPVDDYVRLAVTMPLEFEPGTDYLYSNFGYRVLSAVIERVTAREYADFMEEEVFHPLGMEDSGVARVSRPASEARVAEGLRSWVIPFGSEPQYLHAEIGRNFGTGYGSGGIYTSASDLLRWDRVLADDAFLTGEQKARLFEPVHAHYACGWVVKKSGLDGRVYQMHSGGNEGFFSQMMRIPEDDLVIIAVGNVDSTDALDAVIGQLFRLCRSLPYREPWGS